MEITFELIFMVSTAFVTAIVGVFTKNRVLPARFIPLQNIAIGLLAAIVATYFNLFDNLLVAILVSLATSLGVGGAYDATQTKIKEENLEEK